MNFDFTGKKIVVTGAGGNLGRAVVDRFIECGGVVCGLYHKQLEAEALRNTELGSGTLRPYEDIDITNRGDLISLANRIAGDVGAVDVVVNTVGGFMMGERVHEMTLDTWNKMMALNVYSLLNVSAAFLPGMIENGGGKVVTIGAGASLKGSAKMGAYAAAKGAVLRLTESMAAELKPDKIKVNCVLPGTIDTPQNREDMPKADFKKWVTPREVAETILFLSSQASDGITGAGIPVFGRA